MNYKLCPLYGLKSKKTLKELLGMDTPSFLTINAKSISGTIKPRIDYKKGKSRLVEPPYYQLKLAQARLLKYLQKIDYEPYVFSGIKGRTVADNARIHCGYKYVYQTDLSKFFPHITRNKVYYFFLKKMAMSEDVSKILADICTIDYKYVDNQKYKEVYDFLISNGLKPNTHLMTGSPVSCILSYLVNLDMFNLIYHKGIKNNIAISIYIDDITFSSINPISNSFISCITKTLKHFGYKISAHKCEYNIPGKVKKITGVIIDKNGAMKVANHIKYRVHSGLSALKRFESTDMSKLKGYLSFSAIIEPKYATTQKLIYEKYQT